MGAQCKLLGGHTCRGIQTHTPTHMQFCCALHMRTLLCVYTLLQLNMLAFMYVCTYIFMYVNLTIFTFLHRMQIHIHIQYTCIRNAITVHRLLLKVHCLHKELLAGRVCPHAHKKRTNRSALELSHSN